MKTVVITGCSVGGIGEALARSFHKRGHSVIATVRNLDKAKPLQDLGIQVSLLDVLSNASIEEFVETINAQVGGSVDILVNNAGRGYVMPVLDADLDEARKVFETNFFGRVALTKALAPSLIRSKGTIVNIGSISAVNPTPFASMYNACCAAVHMWSDTFRLEMQPFDVRVILVITGAIKSEFLSNLPTKTLPPTSLYLPEAKAIEDGMNGRAIGEAFTDTERYADAVVSNILSHRPKSHHWVGLLTTRIWLVWALVWVTAWDYILPRSFGLTALRKKFKEKELAGN